MKKKFALAGAVALAVTALAAPAAQADAPSCNWGTLTADAIADGFDQGEHASSFAGSPRLGLANVVNQGDLNATCEFLAG
jgi:hypothetical protein